MGLWLRSMKLMTLKIPPMNLLVQLILAWAVQMEDLLILT